MITVDTTALCRDLSSPAPKLKTLVIVPRSASRLYLPTIFKRDLPEPRQFTIERATFDFTQFRTPNLTHLSLQYTAHDEPVMADLLDFLDQVPLLENPVMVAAGPFCDEAGFDDDTDNIVHLPRLSQLELAGVGSVGDHLPSIFARRRGRNPARGCYAESRRRHQTLPATVLGRHPDGEKCHCYQFLDHYIRHMFPPLYRTQRNDMHYRFKRRGDRGC